MIDLRARNNMRLGVRFNPDTKYTEIRITDGIGDDPLVLVLSMDYWEVSKLAEALAEMDMAFNQATDAEINSGLAAVGIKANYSSNSELEVSIVDMPGLVGRTVVAASRWSDGSGMSAALDDGGILQISATAGDEKHNFEPVIHCAVEYPPCGKTIKPASLEERIEDLYGKRCPDYAPGCVVCDAWHAYDVGAYACVRADIDQFYAEEEAAVDAMFDAVDAPIVLEEGHDPAFNMTAEEKRAVAAPLWPAGRNTEGD